MRLRLILGLAAALAGCGFLPFGGGDDARPGSTTGTVTAVPTGGASGSVTSGMVDADGDGYPASVDCNDDVPSINPSATDVVGDYIDQNCDGLDGVDADGDGFADVDSGGDDCDDADAAITPDDGDGDGVSSCDGDCNDGDSAISPSTLETCTGLDNDCDGQVDLTSIGLDTCLRVDISTVTFEADVLFVIDDSCSMLEEQGRLAATAFDFIDPLWATVDLHIGVVTTDMDNPARSGSLQYVGLYNYVDNTT